jgi:hypothetical protein
MIVGFQTLYGTGCMTHGDIFANDGCKTQAVTGTCKVKSSHRRMDRPASFHICLLPCFGDRLMIARQRLMAA